MGGINPNPPPDSDAPAKTALEADQQNVIGNENRKRVGLSYWEQTSQQPAVQQPQQQPTNRPGFPPGYVGGTLNPDG